jgi:hypothetical protein
MEVIVAAAVPRREREGRKCRLLDSKFQKVENGVDESLGPFYKLFYGQFPKCPSTHY